MTGRLPRPQSLSPGLCVQPAAATHASHWAKVTSYLPAAKGCAKVTLRCGPSSGLRPRSLGGDPIMNSPAGTAIISGHSAQSWNVFLGPAASPDRLPLSWASDTDSCNRMRRRKVIVTRKVGPTALSTGFDRLLQGTSIWPNVGRDACKIIATQGLHVVDFYRRNRPLPKLGNHAAAHLCVLTLTTMSDLVVFQSSGS